MQRTFQRCFIPIVAILALTLTIVRQANADLEHRYSFTANANDSVGAAHGTVIDAGTATNAMFVGGLLNVTANSGNPSNGITEDAYVNLPNGIVSALGNNATFETWVNVETNRDWAEIFAFGTSRPGEDISGGFGKYITLIPDSGNAANTLQLHSIQFDPEYAPFGVTEIGAAGGAVLAPGVQHHIVGVYDSTDTAGGATAGRVSLYLDGALVQSAPLYAGFTLSSIPDVNNWLGRSQWPDPLFDGSYNEFRMYDHALGGGDVALNNILGPDVLAPPGGVLSLEVNTVTGLVTLINNVSVDIPINYYEITSAGDALSTSGWNSLDDQELGDPPGQGWDESGGINAGQLIELFLAEAGDTIAAGAELTLGNAFDESVFGSGNDGDLVFQFGLTGASGLLPGSVTYVTSTALPGDYNGDGTVNAADYVAWRKTPGAFGGNPTGYNTWRQNFGESGGGGAGAGGSVPEPSTSLSLLTALAALVAGPYRAFSSRRT